MVKTTVLFKRCELFKLFIRYKLICTQGKVILNQKYTLLKFFYNLAFVEINKIKRIVKNIRYITNKLLCTQREMILNKKDR